MPYVGKPHLRFCEGLTCGGGSLLDCLLDEEERAPLLETFDCGLFLLYTSSK